MRSFVPVRRSVLALAVSLAATAQAELVVTNDFSVTSSRVEGPGQGQSSLTPGGSVSNVLGLHARGTRGEYRYQFNVGLKATDDEKRDPDKVTLTNLQGSLGRGLHQLTVGDAYEAFSQYTLNAAVKGAAYHYGGGDQADTEVVLIEGVAYPRWQSFWEDDAAEQKVSGLRVRQALGSDLSVAVSVVQQDDDDRFATESLYQNVVGGLDWEYLPIDGLTLRGESAFNDTRESPAAAPRREYDGSAHKLEAIGDGGPSRVALEYERVAPDFFSGLGAATADREKARADWRYRPQRDTTWRFGMLWYQDNLDGQLVATTQHYRPSVDWTRRQLAGRPAAQLDLSYRMDSARSAIREQLDHLMTLAWRDRFGAVDVDAEYGANFYDTEAAGRNEAEHFGNLAFAGRLDAGRWVVKPSLRAGLWTQQEELADSRATREEYSLGLGVDAPHYRVTSTWRVGRSEQDRDAGAAAAGATPAVDSDKTFAAASVFYRPEALAGLRDATLYLRLTYNDFGYAAVGRDYREESAVAGIRFQL